MRAGWIVNGLLLILVVALAAYAYFRPRGDEAARHKIASITRASVDHIAIAAKGSDTIEIAKRGTEWFLVQPFAARADPGQVERILELLDATSKDKLAATELARFDLEDPALTVTFNDVRIAFGTVNPLTQEQYALSGGSVYLLSAFYPSLVPRKADRLLAHNLFLDSEHPVTFSLKSFTVAQHDGKWQLTPAPADAKEAPSQDDLNGWVEGWRHASSLITQRADSRQPTERVEITFADGKKLRLGILQRSPELVLMRPDEQLQFHLSQDLASQLLRPPAPAPAPAVTPASPASAVPAQ